MSCADRRACSEYGIDLAKRNALIDRCGRLYVEARRMMELPPIRIDMRKLNRAAGRDMHELLHRMVWSCDRERFSLMTEEAMAQEILRMEREGFPEPPEVDPAKYSLMGTVGGYVIHWGCSVDRTRLPTLLLTLDDFFDGNTDPRSIGFPSERAPPDMGALWSGLRGVCDAPEVVEARMYVTFWPDPDDPDENGMWLRGGLMLWTWDVRPRDVRGLLEPLGIAHVRQANAFLWLANRPPMKAGMRMWNASWAPPGRRTKRA